MVLDNKHYISLYVNGQLLDLSDDVRIRLNNVVFDPETNVTTQAEYSFSFDVPSTPNNDKIFNYANNLPKLNKFNIRLNTELYSDEVLIFQGSLTIREYDHSDKTYKCNLVSYKVNDLDSIFGDSVLTDIPWYVDFQGASTINAVNADQSTKYFFPLAAYGVFQKKPYLSDDVGNEYTSKFDIDKYNKFWIESFYPSMTLMETIKKALEWKGYNVGGSAFQDPIVSNIFASTNLADEQTPVYNLGNPRFGRLEIGCQWNNFSNDSGYWIHDLDYPYYKVGYASNAPYNFNAVDVWNVWDSTNNPSGVQITNLSEQYIYDPDEHLIVIPADGWYKIRMIVGAEISGYNQTFEAYQNVSTNLNSNEFETSAVTITNNIQEETPIEFHLVKNYDDNVELIKGKRNVRYLKGNPNIAADRVEWDTDYPHQKLGAQENPTKAEAATNAAVASTDIYDSQGRTGGRIEGTPSSTSRNRRRVGGETILGYMHKDGKVMPYDQNVSESFICGFSSLGNGTVSIAKNGRSWYKGNAIKNKIFANVDGMDYVTKSGGTITASATSMNYNTLTDSPSNYCEAALGMYLNGQCHCVTWLNKNDVLEILAIQRDYDGQKYKCSASTYVLIEAMTPQTSQEKLRAEGFSYYSPTEWPYELNLSNFMSNETKIVDFINNVVEALNLVVTQDGKNINFDLNRGIKKDITAAIDIDDRVSDDEAVSLQIDYPAQMGVTFNVNTEEYGFEQSVPTDWINTEEWAEHGDSGYSIIQLSNDTYNVRKEITNTKFSYNWYCNFNLKDANDNIISYLQIPVIEKSEYMADGYGYDEAMAHDGYSLRQRLWFRSAPKTQSLKLSSWMDESVNITLPVRIKDGFALSYYPTEKSMLTELFNVHPLLSSNFVEIEAYLTPLEYLKLKSGTLIHFNDDLYYICEIDGFDAEGKNRTKLKMIKK